VVTALAAWTAGLVAGAPGPIEEAGERLAACGRGPEAAQARHDAAVTAARAGAPDEARRLATPAFVTYDALGAQHLHRRLRAELRQHGVMVRPRRTPPRAQSGWESLTLSESTVVDLAGEGLTNTQIAEQLYVSRRTVESHLGRIYTKLELSTRAQLVAATARRSRP
jgi:DNA-binding CsgD family transcriptional regulator